ncbi:hypothetical protein [Methanotorris formicicus]|uniref:Uncharacterized protein n=1 Tax=Methanotorris formicicus Mc-S-70 TaxID=647171 RepID=H1KWG0_9EURY|nr:hypothetical protein [Methanotorris formicicus]EHP89537.1 hypothetical protein MetfoDRAFT_0133 [Methanotorris formicicus Mc-S-70]
MSIISGLSLAFYNLSFKDKENLSKLRGLFKTDRPKGKCSNLGIGRGLPTLADHLLLRMKDGNVEDSPSIKN